MAFIFVLFSEADKKHYTGYAHNLIFSFEQHTKGIKLPVQQDGEILNTGDLCGTKSKLAG